MTDGQRAVGVSPVPEFRRDEFVARDLAHEMCIRDRESRGPGDDGRQFRRLVCIEHGVVSP